MTRPRTGTARTTGRILELLERLQSGDLHRVADLAARLGVDERTVRRDVQRLVELDIPVRTVRGRHGGYRIDRGFRLPPLMFTDDEAIAVVLGLRYAPAAADGTADAAVRATAKLRRVLSAELLDRVDTVAAAVDVVADRAGRRGNLLTTMTDGGARTVVVLAAAIRDRRPVVFDHADRAGRRGERHVHPYGLVGLEGRLYLSGFDTDRRADRVFRVDRIAFASVREGTFEIPEGFDAVTTVQSHLARTPWRHEVVLRMQAQREEVHAVFPPRLATVDDDVPTPGWLRVRLRVERLDWLPGVLAAQEHLFVVEEPAELREQLREVAARLVAAI